MSSPLLSLCIPTNGIIEWVFPVLDSIYAQNVDNSLFEVVVTDNGNNEEFKTMILEFSEKHANLVYKETEAKGFLNEIECYKLAFGTFIKFINHRTKLLPGSIGYLIDFVQKNCKEKPCVYFGNGVIHGVKGIYEYANFDSYVRGLSYWSSWSTGMGFWKEDFDRIPGGTEFNKLYPHTTILFAERNKLKYIIDNNVLLEEIYVGHTNKGKYNLFHAFGVEYMGIICDLLRAGFISTETFLSVKKENLKFIGKLYLDFVVFKQKCSYSLSGIENSLGVFYGNIKKMVFLMLCAKLLKQPIKIVRKLINMRHNFEKLRGGGS